MARPVNRSLANPHMDDIDHALGRPKNPLRPPGREHYVCSSDGPLAAAMRASPHWQVDSIINDGRSTVFTVTRAGRMALAAHLEELAEMARRAEGQSDG